MPRPSLEEIFGRSPKEVAAPQQSYFDRLGQDVYGRANELADSIVAYRNNEITTPELLIQGIGKAGAGTINDVIGQTMVSGYRSLPQGAQDALGSAGEFIGDSWVGDAARYAGNEYTEFAKENPRAAKNIESVVNVGSLAMMTKGAQNPTKEVGKLVQKTGNKVTQSGVKSANANKANFVQDLITPKETAKVLNEQATRATEKGLLRSRVVQPTAMEKEVMAEVSKLPVKSNRSLLHNYNVIKDTIAKEADSLSGSLKAKNVVVGMDDIQGMIDDSMGRLNKHTLLTGDAGNTAQRAVAGLNDELLKVGVRDGKFTAANLLEARKNFDNWVLSQKSTGQVFGDRATALNVAVGDLRQGLNSLIESKVPDAGFKASLREQSNLYRALEGLETKVGLEGKNVLSRVGQKAMDSVPGRNALYKTAAGIAGAGAVASSPATAITGLAGYGAYKGLTSPATRKALGSGIQAAGRGIQQGAGALNAAAVTGAQGLKQGSENVTSNNSNNSLSDIFGSAENPSGVRPSLEEIFGATPAQPVTLERAPLDIEPQAGLPNGYMEKTAMAESSGGKVLKSTDPTSTASGHYGINDDTWKLIVKKWGKEHDLKLSDRGNKDKEAKGAYLLSVDNARILQNSLKRQPTKGDLYVAHFMGAGDGVKMIKNRNSKMIAAKVFPDAAAQPGNKPIFYNNGKPRTIAEVYQLLARKMEA